MSRDQQIHKRCQRCKKKNNKLDKKMSKQTFYKSKQLFRKVFTSLVNVFNPTSSPFDFPGVCGATAQSWARSAPQIQRRSRTFFLRLSQRGPTYSRQKDLNSRSREDGDDDSLPGKTEWLRGSWVFIDPEDKWPSVQHPQSAVWPLSDAFPNCWTTKVC